MSREAQLYLFQCTLISRGAQKNAGGGALQVDFFHWIAVVGYRRRPTGKNRHGTESAFRFFFEFAGLQMGSINQTSLVAEFLSFEPPP
jgi:hypothetical protein